MLPLRILETIRNVPIIFMCVLLFAYSIVSVLHSEEKTNKITFLVFYKKCLTVLT